MQTVYFNGYPFLDPSVPELNIDVDAKPHLLDFAILGYCSKGANCSERHVHECPNYANTGICRKPKCHLPHIDRAGQIKKHAANVADRANGSEKDDDSDIVSDDDNDEIDSDDVDSDGLEEVMQLSDDTVSRALSQQQDFVQF
ncbi:MAG: hypothetical protein Q9175_004413 [Cornicularia normoerica]